jgi:hypothetical protein
VLPYHRISSMGSAFHVRWTLHGQLRSVLSYSNDTAAAPRNNASTGVRTQLAQPVAAASHQHVERVLNVLLECPQPLRTQRSIHYLHGPTAHALSKQQHMRHNLATNYCQKVLGREQS